MTKFFKETLFRGHFGPFLPKVEQKWIFLERKLCQFSDIPIIYNLAKNKKKLMTQKIPNWRTDRQTDEQADRQTDNHDFLRLSVGRGSYVLQIRVGH